MLVWRDVRIRDNFDFIIIVEELGGMESFMEYDLAMKRSAYVDQPSDLLDVKVVQNLVKRKLGLPEELVASEQ